MLALACSGGASPCATSDDDVADARLESLLGPYSECVSREWVPSDHLLADLAASDVSDHPGVWTAGSFVLDELSGVRGWWVRCLLSQVWCWLVWS